MNPTPVATPATTTYRLWNFRLAKVWHADLLRLREMHKGSAPERVLLCARGEAQPTAHRSGYQNSRFWIGVTVSLCRSISGVCASAHSALANAPYPRYKTVIDRLIGPRRMNLDPDTGSISV